MRIGSLANDGQNSYNAQLGTLFNCPLHSIELKDGEEQGNPRRDLSPTNVPHFFPELKVDTAIGYLHNRPTPHGSAYGNIEFLAHAHAENSNQMVGMRSGQRCTVPG